MSASLPPRGWSVPSRLRSAVLALAMGMATWGCAATRALGGGQEGAVQLGEVRLRFTAGERGDLELDLTATNPGLPGAAYTEVSWELWLGNRWFAAGTQVLAEPAPQNLPHPLVVRAPLVFRRSQSPREEAVPVDVSVRGAVTLRAPAGTLRLPFEGSRRMRVANLPQSGGRREAED